MACNIVLDTTQYIISIDCLNSSHSVMNIYTEVGIAVTIYILKLG